MKSSDDERQLLSLIAHELRSPGAVVAGYLRLLRKETGDLPERTRRMIEEADRSCARVLQLVKELSELSELAASDALVSGVPVAVFPLCDEVVRAASSAGSPATFSCDPEDQSTMVQGDANRLKRAFAALMAAALRERGAQSLEIHGFVGRDAAVPEAVIALGDPGLALRRDKVLNDRPLSFDRWRGGTGLSIPIACRIVEGHGGRVWSLPQDSRGACALSLPAGS